VEKLPLLGTGKADYPAVTALVEKVTARGTEAAT
jgi:hypothetical protein